MQPRCVGGSIGSRSFFINKSGLFLQMCQGVLPLPGTLRPHEILNAFPAIRPVVFTP